MSDLHAWGAWPVFCKSRQCTAGAQGCIARWLPSATAPESLQETGMHSLSLLANAGVDAEALLESLVECVRVFDQKSPEMSASTKRRHLCTLMYY
jgi:hypothetical protein